MLQDIHQVSLIQRYPLGFKYPISNPLDLRAFRYARAGGTLHTDFGAVNATPQLVGIAGPSEITADAKAGEVLVAILVKATDGKGGDGAIDADELVGGNIVIYPHNENTINRMIVGNTATTAPAGGVMVVRIDKPLPCPLTDGDTMHAECMANPYRNVKTPDIGHASVVGMPTMPAKIHEYLWLQTWGPLWIAPNNGVSAGDNERQVVFRDSGAIDLHKFDDAVTTMQQHAGFVIANLRTGAPGAPFIFLQITP